MSIKMVLFDLDGTLLPMDQEMFVGSYFKMLAGKLVPKGYDPQKLVKDIWAGTAAMVKNTGEVTNEEAFWNTFAEIYGEQVRKDIPMFDEFYRNEFQQVQSVCGYNPKAAEVVKYIKEKGLRIALATNPIFPAIATQSRARWAGIDVDDFEIYTTYENSSHCKPNSDYYRDVLCKLDVQAEECLMVGNDVTEDMVAETLGMKVFLLTDCLINKEDKDISVYPNGGFEDLIKYIDNI